MGLAVLLALAGCEADENKPTQSLPPDTVGPAGGTLSFDDGKLSIEVPQGALGRPVTFTVTKTDTVPAGLGSPRYTIGPAGTTFSEPVSVRIALDPAAIDGKALAKDMTGGVLTPEGWQGAPSHYDASTGHVVLRTFAMGPPPMENVTGTARTLGGGTSVAYVHYFPLPPGGDPVPSCDRELILGGGQEYGALLPRYVDASLGDDLFTGDVGTPWKSLTASLPRLALGQKLVVRGGTYTNAPGTGESFPLDLPPNVVMEAEGGAVIHGVADPSGPVLYPILRVDSEPNHAYVKGFTIHSDVNPGIPADLVNRNRAISVLRGSPTFEAITSTTTFGVGVIAGTPLFRDFDLRDAAARIEVFGGEVAILSCTLRGVFTYVDSESAAVYAENGNVCVESSTFRDNPYGIHAPLHGSVTATRSTFRGNGIGILFGTIPWSGATDVVYDLRENTIRDNTRAGVATATPADSRSLADNTYDHDPPEIWWGPPPFVEPIDQAHLLNPLGPGRWWKLRTSPSARFGAEVALDNETGDYILFGGRRDTSNLDDTWAFDVRDVRWTDVTDPIATVTARVDHMMGAVTTRPDHNVFLVGGHTNGSPDHVFGCDTVWVYDGAARQWNALLPSGTPPPPRYAGTFTPLSTNSPVLALIGGVEAGSLIASDIYWYDTTANAWSVVDPFTGSLQVAFHAAAPFSDGIFVYGGRQLGGPWNNVWIQRPDGSIDGVGGSGFLATMFHTLVPVNLTAAGQWRFTAIGGTDGPTILGLETVFIARDAGGFFGSGDWVPLNLAADTPRLPRRARHASFAWVDPLRDDIIVVTGGVDSTGSGTTPLADSWIYMRGAGE